MSIRRITQFYRFALLIKPAIEIKMLDNTSAPQWLPLDIQEALATAMSADVETILQLWSLSKDEIWQESSTNVDATNEEISQLNMSALKLGISYRHLYPPMRVCADKNCVNYRAGNAVRTLTDARTHKASLFTLSHGALPVFTTSLYCRGCNTRYHHTHSVHDASNAETFYERMPDVLQVAEHCFIDAALLEFFASAKAFGWLSSMNCARIYNVSMASRSCHIRNNPMAYPRSCLPPIHPEIQNWQTSLSLSDVQVLNGFFMYSLMLDKAERLSILTLPHDAESQRDRLKPALEERNKRMEGIGQEKYTHACDLCFKVFEKDGHLMKMQGAVADGNTIGHPCCAVHDCKAPLANHRERYCTVHRGEMGTLCAVEGCSSFKEQNFRTCGQPEHRSLETSYFQKGKALFQLQSRLKKAGVPVPQDSAAVDQSETDNDIDGGDGLDCDGKSEEGNRKAKAYFGRRRTHNEQLIMRPCGIILARATFFGSEAISAVNEFAKRVFPTPQSTPEYFIFDNNCKLLAHQRRIGDDHFKDTAQPVDVFHFRSKHKETDTNCQRFCNPAAFPELIKDGKWEFNTSICEQANVWLGGFQAILRDMEATRFNFYLDEMIKRRNRYVEQELRRRGHGPWAVPICTLFPVL